jgi:hypothetical protein
MMASKARLRVTSGRGCNDRNIAPPCGQPRIDAMCSQNLIRDSVLTKIGGRLMIEHERFTGQHGPHHVVQR